MTAVLTTHIRLDDRSVAWIDDTNVKVIEVALEKRAHGFSPEEIAYQHYHRLSLAQVHAALAYYYDHQIDLDAEMDRQLQESEQQRTASLDSPGRQRLRALGKLP